MKKVQKKKHLWHKLLVWCFVLAGIGMIGTNQSVHAATTTKKYHTDKYYKNKETVTKTKTVTTYGQMEFLEKYKQRTVTKKVTKTKTVYYKHTKEVTTTTTQSKSKEKLEYSKKKTQISDVKKYLPACVYERWQKSGYSIIQNPVDKDFKDNSVVGFFSTKRKAIVLREYKDDQKTFLHELGHFVDWSNDQCTKTSSFKSIYESESKNMASDAYGKTSAAEYFAECFQMYCKDKSSFQKKYPKTYKYINNVIQNM